MTASPDSDPDSLGPDRLLLIVVGAHLQAEQAHRPLGYRLRLQMGPDHDQQQLVGAQGVGILSRTVRTVRTTTARSASMVTSVYA